jgi:hypothetical protein
MPTPAKYTDDELLAALKEGGSKRAAARLLGVASSSVMRKVDLLVSRGWSPEHGWTHTVPQGYRVRGVSTLYDAEGNQRAQWVKSQVDPEAMHKALRETVDALAEDIRGAAKPVKAPAYTTDRSLSAYIIGDAHFGLYAWAEEAGDDFDTNMASADLRAAVDLLVDGAPASEVGFLVDVGDFLHADNRSNMTPASGNILDVDSRFPRVRRIAVQALRYCINRMLKKHARVEVFQTPGNHNPESAGWMAMILEAYYENEPRVRVETSPAKFFYARHGKCLIGITHGDKVKMAEMPSIMATDRPKDWGETEFRYLWTGHIHHTKHQEYRGCFVESFNTLAASDAWHQASGYRSARQMQRIDLDTEYGIYNRGIASLKRVRDYGK